MSELDSRDTGASAGVSVGAGIAIAAMWLVGGGVTSLFAWLALGLGRVTAERPMDQIVLGALIAAPLIIARSTTRELLRRDG